MILQSLHLQNFGLYGGYHEFDLVPDPASGKTVILVVGHNGSGKTTFLEAVRLALYGKRALGARVGQTEYEQYLLRRINNTASERSAFVELTFTSHHLEKDDTYTVRRAWASRGASVVESLQFNRNGAPVDEIPRDDWNHYLEDIIPAGVSQLFFFDGEKIQDIADDQDNAGLTDAIKSLLGIDLIDQLRGDLALYKARNADSQDIPDLEATKRDLEIARTELVIADEQIGSLSSQRAQLARRSEAAQLFFEREGGNVALSRETLTNELKKVDTELSKNTATLKNLANGAVPFALAPKLVKNFSSKVERAKGVQSHRTITQFIASFEAAMINSAADEWQDTHFETLRAFSAGTQADARAVPLSSDPEWILSKLNTIADDRVKVAGLAATLSELQNKRAAIRAQIKNFRPGAAATAFEELKKAEYELGALETELKRKQAEATQQRALAERLERELRKSQEAVFDIARAKEQRDLATRAQTALNDYEKRIVQMRLASLSNHFIEAFNGLVTRKRVVQKVSVDPNTFHIRLYRTSGEEITPSELSAGERQLFAISMLWALGKTSGRELPMIIDTPLSRLDRQHRTSLMENYIPHTSAQVIMLCTDSELTPDLATIIEPHVHRRYEISVVDGGLTTTVLTSSSQKSVEEAEPSYAH
ncbi:DNA sulfur modification protein DndD [Celeribacter neptunius]|uniref:DNA sulfur modification protein DndD n=1 Tax=Celeribacter neptunius TaxID=588602 RepID=A0A1I3XU18_9RHOB|nr:DNA sulfur modification protein DndD [Celeribacter neptunius]SFK23024.1 DNA sulfur modification protein DndD [Celeribacter neptunius]